MRVVLPFRGEFGIKIFWYVPAVHAIPGPKVVYGEEGQEALYPSAEEFIPVARKGDDGKRRNHYHTDGAFVREIAAQARERFGPNAKLLKPTDRVPRARFIPRPVETYGIRAEVVVCPRWRRYGASKNWDAWPWLVDRLIEKGVDVFAAGHEESSYDVDCPAAWAYERDIDATLEAMHSAKVVVATDAGLAHLAVLAGRPLLMVVHEENRIAPGPSSDENGRVMDPEYGPVKIERFLEANHTGSEIKLLSHSWLDPEIVLEAVLARARRFW
jgi:ADP-heptose:LPS heptosyltransferase